MAVYNNQAIQNGPYQLVAPVRHLNGRLVHKYICNLNGDRARVAAATNVVVGILRDNPLFHPTFDIENREALEQIVEHNPYLTINGYAVSLATERDAPGNAHRDYWDRYFSETLMEEPVRCPQGHFFERRRAVVWAGIMHHVCPVGGGDHLVGNLQIDEALQEDIGRYRNHRNDRQQREQQRIDHNGVLHINNRALHMQHQAVREVQAVNSKMMVGAAVKTVVKLGGEKAMAKVISKVSSKATAATAAKTSAKAIPLISLLIGIGFFIYRTAQGQYVRALGELVSGAAPFVPVVGTAASVALDLCMAGYDAYEATTIQAADVIEVADLDLNDAYQVLGINPQENPNPPRDLVDHQYRDNARLLHPDRNREIGDYNQQALGQMMAALNRARAVIFERRGWQ